MKAARGKPRKIRRGLIAAGAFAIVLGIIPWTGDFRARGLLVLAGFVFVVAAFPGYEFLLAARRFATESDKMDDDTDE